MSTTKGIIDGLRTGERECIKPKAGDADLWIKNWEELHRSGRTRYNVVEVEHVKAHHTAQRKIRKICRTLRSLSLLTKRRRMSWQKQEQCWTKDSWRKREQRQCSKKEKRCMQLCSTQPAFTVWWRNGKTVKSSGRRAKRKVDFR